MRQALGRGLEALIPLAPPPAAGGTPNQPTTLVPLDKIRPNHLQPRRYFDPERLAELSASIKENGLAQPLVVSFDQKTNSYELIAGERRLRACALAGLKEVEVVVRTPSSDKQRLAIALVENLQREDLNAVEQALGYLRLMKEFQISQTEVGQVVGKSKSAVSNTLRLLELPEDMQKAIQFGQLSEGHARALLMVKNILERQRLFGVAQTQKLSVRDLEDLCRVEKAEFSETPAQNRKRLEKSADIKEIENTLREKLGTKVQIKTRKDPTKGTVTFYFYSLSDFDKIIETFKK